jgi:hypothetical protein
VALSIIGQCFLYRAAGDVVAMLVPDDEVRSHHSLRPLADHVTRYALAALGAAPPLVEHHDHHEHHAGEEVGS